MPYRVTRVFYNRTGRYCLSYSTVQAGAEQAPRARHNGSSDPRKAAYGVNASCNRESEALSTRCTAHRQPDIHYMYMQLASKDREAYA
jgi:hypothetical protein